MPIAFNALAVIWLESPHTSLANGVDFVAASFVSTGKDMEDIRNFLDENGSIRPGLEVFNEFCEGQVDERC